MKTHQKQTAAWLWLAGLRACLKTSRILSAAEAMKPGHSISSSRQVGAVGAFASQPLPFRRALAKPALILAALILGLSTNAARSQNFSITWSKIAGGGGTCTNGQYTLSGTLGQHDAGGPLKGGGFTLTGGFWAPFAVQTPGAPLLRIFLTSSNTAVVAWPAPSTGWTLQYCANLTTPNWSAAGGTVSVVGNENQVIIQSPTGNRFFRLVHPYPADAVSK